MTAPSLNPELLAVTDRIKARSRDSRRAYLAKIEKARRQGPHRGSLSCSNLAHGFAACGAGEKQDLSGEVKPNIAIVSAYNDMLLRTSRSSSTPTLFGRPWRRRAASPWLPVAFRPCAMA